MDWSIIAVIIQLIFLEGILSIDNAAVLGAMVAVLPSDQDVQWPRSLHGLGRALHPFLGPQRTAALRVGLLGAYVGRGIMLVLASFVVQNPWLKLLGAAYLIRLAFNDLAESAMEEDVEGQPRSLQNKGFWMIVLNVELADLVFSLDNVVAAVSLSDKLWVVMVGVALGILMMRFAAGLFSIAVEKEHILKKAAYILVLNIGVELLLEDLAHVEIGDWLRFGISIGTLVLCILYAHLKFLHVFRPVLLWLSQGIRHLNGLVDWALAPVYAFLRLLGWLLRLIFGGGKKSAQEV